jgi:hypothetical protein
VSPGPTIIFPHRQTARHGMLFPESFLPTRQDPTEGSVYIMCDRGIVASDQPRRSRSYRDTHDPTAESAQISFNGIGAGIAGAFDRFDRFLGKAERTKRRGCQSLV